MGETATVTGELTSIKNIYTKGGKNFTEGVLTDESGQIKLIWFNQPFLTRNLKKDTKIAVAGSLTTFSNKPAIIGPDYEVMSEGKETLHTGRLVPIYPETSGVTSKWLRSRIKCLLDLFDPSENLPKNLIDAEDFLKLAEALPKIHFPTNQSDIDKSRERFGFEELFLLALQSNIRKEQWQTAKLSKKINVNEEVRCHLEEFTKLLPFSLTNGQNKAIDEILTDLQKDQPMNRLLEGDVGSGKTVVAAIAAYTAVLNSSNVLYLAPTEILANQHYETFKRLFEKCQIDILLITGNKKVGSTIKPLNHSTITIGTHALLYQDKFEDVGLVIIDEQHRFGVEQRAKLLSQTTGTPHLLTMTATPIPRSLQLVIFGDLDLSIIDEMPIGRKRVKTWVVPKHKRSDAYKWVVSQCRGTMHRAPTDKNPTQAFIVCPFIDESEVDTLKSVRAATKEFEGLTKTLAPLKLGLLHGRLKPKEKDTVVKSFRNKEFDVLVTTPVVEVGVDIPSANIMIIEGAERFGLASLHQLRGRVGRGGEQAYCLLFTSDDKSDAVGRLKILETSYNGAELAEADLKFRGSGDLFGTAQHGVITFKVANPGDQVLVKKARDWAERVVSKVDKYPELSETIEEIKKAEVAPN